MKVILAYHCVAGLSDEADKSIENYALMDDYSACAVRFAKTYLQYPAWSKHKLIVNVCDGEIDKRIMDIFEGIKCEFAQGTSEGRDNGAQQRLAPSLDCDFAVFMTARTYFHRSHWLERMVEARKKHGEGIYGSSASMEACPLDQEKKPNPHLRTGFFGMNPKAFNAYPVKIDSVEAGFNFESGEFGIHRWFSDQGKPVKMVAFGGDYDLEDCRTPNNVFRKGDQSNLLAWDRHCGIFNVAIDADKKFLQTIADGESPE